MWVVVADEAGGLGEEVGESRGEDAGAVADADDDAGALRGVWAALAGFEADDAGGGGEVAVFAGGDDSGEADFFGAVEHGDDVGILFVVLEIFEEGGDGGDGGEVVADASGEDFVFDLRVGEVPHAEGGFGDFVFGGERDVEDAGIFAGFDGEDVGGEPVGVDEELDWGVFEVGGSDAAAEFGVECGA